MNTKKKILIVSEFFPRSDDGEARGGVEMRSWQIAKRLVDTYDVTVLAAHEDGIPREQHFSGVHVIRCSPTLRYSQTGSLFQRLRLLVQFYRQAVRFKPDLIDAQSFVAYVPSFWAAKKIGIPCIATCHDVWSSRWTRLFGVSGIIGELYERYYLTRKWSHFIANSNYTKNNLIETGIKHDKVTTIHNGVALKGIHDIHVTKYESPTICTITRLVDYKRVGDLLRAIQQLKHLIPSIQCKIIGSGPQREQLMNQAGELGVLDRVQFLGFVKTHKEVIRILKRSHVFCLPSEIEGFGIVVAEAMAAGIPAIGTNIPPLQEVTKNGKAALLYETGDIEALVSHLSTMLLDRKKAEHYRTTGFDVVKKFNWDDLAQQTKNEYSKLV